MTKRIFIDGLEGTTGLQIHQRLSALEQIEVMQLPEAQRKDKATRRAILNEADLAVLCLPDEAALEAVAMVQSDVKILDTSTVHRTDMGWTYGMPEWSSQQAAKIAASQFVANPGCYAIGAITLLRPLIAAELLPKTAAISIDAVSGYTGGGKPMIADYTNNTKPSIEAYALAKPHKHCAEIHKHSGLETAPLLTPLVGNFPQGMMVSISYSGVTAEDAHATLTQAYQAYPHIIVQQDRPNRIDVAKLAGLDDIYLYVFGQQHWTRMVALFDNLGKGAAGTALENIKLMLALEQKQVA